MCAECDKYGRPMNDYCRSVAHTKSLQAAIEKTQARKRELEKEKGNQ